MENNNTHTTDQASSLRETMENLKKANRIIKDMDCRIVVEFRDDAEVYFVNTDADPDVGTYGRKVSPPFKKLADLHKWIIENERKIESEMLDVFRRSK